MKTFKEISAKKYPDGELISKNLPPAYKVGNAKENCENCGAYKAETKYCSIWDAKVRPNYWCKKWIPIEK